MANFMVLTPSPLLLIVEDEFMIANDLRQILDRSGYQVIGIAESVPEAMELIENQPPDIVLLDIFLDGDQTGIDLAHWLQERNTPFVFLSANLTDSILAAAKATQPYGFLNKPFREKDVLTTLEIARYRHAHSEEARLRQQQTLQMAVNNAIIAIQDRQQLCFAIADQINQLVPFSFFKLLIVRPVENYRYLFIIKKTASGELKPFNLSSLLQRELQEDDKNLLEQELQLQVNMPGGLYSGLDFEELCERFQIMRSCRDYLGIRSLALCPIQLNQDVITSLSLGQTDLNGFSKKEYDLINLIIPEIALALTNLLSYEEIDAQRQLKSTELAIVTAFQNGKNLPEIVLQVAKSLNNLLPFDRLTVFHQRKPSRTASFIALSKKNGQFEQIMNKDTPQKMVSDPDCWPAQTTILEEWQLDEIFTKKEDFNESSLRSFIVIPIYSKGQGLAQIVLGSYARYAFTQRDGLMLDQIRGTLAMAFENFQAFEQIKSLSDQLEREKTYLVEEINNTANFEEMVGNSPAMLAVFKSISQVAPTDSTVLILGETGTGKELIARAVHNLSNRKKRAMVKVNCAALPPQLIESELFGHEKGSFTGAIEKRIGKFELADGGTIFLDEIGELPLELQSKLLRVIQEKEIERVGGKGPIRVDVRIIAATNRNLEKEVAMNQFRLDLFYRLNVFPIQLPPLRDRREDLLPLSMHFLKKIGKKLGKTFTGITNSSIFKMHNYRWPGNIRELEYVLERAAIVSEKTTLEITETLQPMFTMSNTMESALVIEPLQETMRAAILAALAHSGNRIRGQGGAAELLNIKPTTLEARMKKLDITLRS